MKLYFGAMSMIIHVRQKAKITVLHKTHFLASAELQVLAVLGFTFYT